MKSTREVKNKENELFFAYLEEERIVPKKVNGKLKIVGRITDYFTIWGFPYAASELFEQCNEEFIKNKEISKVGL